MITNDFDYLLSDDDENTEEKVRELLSEFGLNMESLESEFNEYTPKRELGYSKISDDAVTPSYNYPSDSGFDLYSTESFEIKSLERKLVPTGLKFDIPDGTEIQIRPKSGLALNLGLTVLNTPGTVDNGYNGEIKVILFNTSSDTVKIDKGMKIAQAVLCPVINGKWVELKLVSDVSNKDRNENGFGSTGV